MKKNTLYCLIAGFVLLLIACGIAVWRIGSLSNAVITHGTVNTYDVRLSDENDSIYTLRASYMDYNDQTHQYWASIGSPSQPYKVGDPIVMQYDRSTPSSSAPVYMHPFNSWGLIWALIMGAIVCIATPFLAKKPNQSVEQNVMRARALHAKRQKKTAAKRINR